MIYEYFELGSMGKFFIYQYEIIFRNSKILCIQIENDKNHWKY